MVRKCWIGSDMYSPIEQIPIGNSLGSDCLVLGPYHLKKLKARDIYPLIFQPDDTIPDGLNNVWKIKGRPLSF